MSGKFRIATVLVVLGLLLTACAAPAPAPAPTAAPAEAEPAEPTAAPEAAKPAGEPVKLVVWWWGEQEAPGAQKWLNETIAKYKEANPNVTFEAVLQSTDTLIPAFQSAAAAKQGPDIQYFWGGVWTLENAWNGAIDPGGRPLLGRGEGALDQQLRAQLRRQAVGHAVVSVGQPIRLQPQALREGRRRSQGRQDLG